ncbi:hypothetical protein KOR34_07840 [Posidoniimonas corsicana]|uniref:Uncharacterized protein n=1 Tax=Posidoniimonas corsicana TaxID=1938618 RepID=A0A5C5VD55_9BACT|nr:hypothetical protein KOR34_07840 [Posidoniimonas corsicana]
MAGPLAENGSVGESREMLGPLPNLLSYYLGSPRMTVVVRRLLMVLCFGVLCAGVGVRTATATCGDWLAHSPPLEEASDASADHANSKAVTPADDPAPGRKCSGPSCSGGQSPPPVATPAPQPAPRELQHAVSSRSESDNAGAPRDWRRDLTRVVALKGFFPVPDPPPRFS